MLRIISHAMCVTVSSSYSSSLSSFFIFFLLPGEENIVVMLLIGLLLCREFVGDSLFTVRLKDYALRNSRIHHSIYNRGAYPRSQASVATEEAIAAPDIANCADTMRQLRFTHTQFTFTHNFTYCTGRHLAAPGLVFQRRLSSV